MIVRHMGLFSQYLYPCLGKSGSSPSLFFHPCFTHEDRECMVTHSLFTDDRRQSYTLFLSVTLRFRHGIPIQCRPLSVLEGFGNCCIGQQVFRSGRLRIREKRGNTTDSYNKHSEGLVNRAGQAIFQYSGSFGYWGTSLTGHDGSPSLPLSFCAPQSNGRFIWCMPLI